MPTPVPLSDPLAVKTQVARSRSSADELDAYAADVKKRGGIYRSDQNPAGCFAVIVLMFLGGGFLIWKAQWEWGIGLVVLAALSIWMMVGSQREPA